MSDVIVRFETVNTNYGFTKALDNASFTIREQDYVVVAGPNGSGKSTLVRALLGIMPHTGQIELFGQPLGKFSHWHRVGYVPQKMYSFNPLFPASVEEIIKLGLLAQKHLPKRFTADDRKMVGDIMQEMDILDLRHKSVQELSGGQQQKVFIARALISTPELLVMDEPTSSLDGKARANLFALLRHMNRAHGVTIIFISHDLSDLGDDATKLLYLENKVVYDGSLKDFCLPDDGHQHMLHHHQRED